MGWRSDFVVSRIMALEELFARVLRMSDEELSELLDHTDPARTVNYRVREEAKGDEES